MHVHGRHREGDLARCRRRGSARDRYRSPVYIDTSRCEPDADARRLCIDCSSGVCACYCLGDVLEVPRLVALVYLLNAEDAPELHRAAYNYTGLQPDSIPCSLVHI